MMSLSPVSRHCRQYDATAVDVAVTVTTVADMMPLLL